MTLAPALEVARIRLMVVTLEVASVRSKPAWVGIRSRLAELEARGASPGGTAR